MMNCSRANNCGWNSRYFFVSCSLQNLIEMHLLKENTLDNFHEILCRPVE